MKDTELIAAAVEANYREGLKLLNEYFRENDIVHRVEDAVARSPYGEVIDKPDSCTIFSIGRLFSAGVISIYVHDGEAWESREPDWNKVVAHKTEDARASDYHMHLLGESDEPVSFMFSTLQFFDDSRVATEGGRADPILEYFKEKLPSLGYDFRTDYEGKGGPTVHARANGIVGRFTQSLEFTDALHDVYVYLRVYSFLCTSWDGDESKRHHKMFFEVGNGSGAENAEHLHEALLIAGMGDCFAAGSSETHESLADEILGIHCGNTLCYEDFEHAMLCVQLSLELAGNPDKPEPNLNILRRMSKHFQTCSGAFHPLDKTVDPENTLLLGFTLQEYEECVASLDLSGGTGGAAGLLITSRNLYWLASDGVRDSCSWQTLSSAEPSCRIDKLDLGSGKVIHIPEGVFNESGARQFQWILDVTRSTVRVDS